MVYGNRPNRELLIYSGFVLNDNEFNNIIVRLKLNDALAKIRAMVLRRENIVPSEGHGGYTFHFQQNGMPSKNLWYFIHVASMDKEALTGAMRISSEENNEVREKILDRQGPHSRWHTVEGPFNCFPICNTAYQKYDDFEDFQRQAPGEKRCEQQYEDAGFDRKPDCQRVHMLGQHCGLVQLCRKSKRDRWLQQHGRAKQGVDRKDEAVENAKSDILAKKRLEVASFKSNRR